MRKGKKDLIVVGDRVLVKVEEGEERTHASTRQEIRDATTHVSGDVPRGARAADARGAHADRLRRAAHGEGRRPEAEGEGHHARRGELHLRLRRAHGASRGPYRAAAVG